MRYFLILIHVVLVALLITAVCAMGMTTSVDPELVGAYAFTAAFALALQFFLTGVTVSAQLAPLLSFLQVIFVIYAISGISVLLAGYKPFRWAKWVGFVLNIALGLLMLSALTKGFAFGTLIISLFFFLCAFLFLRMKRNSDAELVRRPAALINLVLWLMGALVYFAASPDLGVSRFIFAAFSAIPFILHYRVLSSFSFQAAAIFKLALTLVFTFICGVVFIFVIPVMFGPLMASWLSVIFFIEAKFLSSTEIFEEA